MIYIGGIKDIGIISCASGSSCWRGLDYYKSKKIRESLTLILNPIIKEKINKFLPGKIKVVVSFDENFSLGNESAAFAGTGATITIYTKVAGVDIPLSTIKVVVKGDINGDGVIDVFDTTLADMSHNGYASVNGVYGLAGDFTSDGKVDIFDLNDIIDIAKQG